MANQKVYEGLVVGICRVFENNEFKVLLTLDCDCGTSDQVQITFSEDNSIEYSEMLMFLKPLRITTYRGHRSRKVRKVEEIEPTNKMYGF